MKQWMQGLLKREWRLSPLVNQVVPSKTERFDWETKSKSPLFNVVEGDIKPGWHLFDIVVNYAGGRLERAYIELVDDSGVAKRYIIPIRNGRPIRRVIWISSYIKAVKFYPLVSPCHFSVGRFDVYRLPALAAKYIMLLKLKKDAMVCKGCSYPQIIRTIRHCATEEHLTFSERLQELYSLWFVRSRSSLDYANWLKSMKKYRNKGWRRSEQANVGVISVIMPTYHSNIALLEKAIDSVTRQTYSDWQLCIVDDASTNKQQIQQLIAAYPPKFRQRIDVAYLEQNQGISATTNHAVKLARGQWFALLDHDDELHQDALSEMAAVIATNPDVQIIYSDEDKMDESGVRFEPHFKSDWNYDLFLSHNYISHLLTCKKSLFESVGGLDSKVDGAQDYDFVLRCLSVIEPASQIKHIPRVLYHWRTVEGSTALNECSKAGTHKAGLLALERYIQREQLPASVEDGVAPHCYRVNWQLTSSPLVSVIIPTRDNHEMLERCLTSLFSKTAYKQIEVLIVNNGSTCAKTLKYLNSLQHKHAAVQILEYNKPFNYSAINNYAATFARGEVLALLNDDVEVIEGNWLNEMVSLAIRPKTGCVGAKLLYSDGRIQHAGVILGIGGVAGHSHKYFDEDEPGYFRRLQLRQNLSAVTAACLVVRKSVYEKAGGLDADNLSVAFNDVDFCLRIRELGYQNTWSPYALLYHHESFTRGADDSKLKRARFAQEVSYMQKRWEGTLLDDPAYNVNLSLEDESFSLRAPELLVHLDESKPLVPSRKVS
ncbi:MAG: glycosyl transferase family 2 [Kangiellaceae bacterium]|nr:glycosyl transferase family 2 [Kangiellaceae bacterium]|tara:strand:- start:15769 stop:18081 length:2313 start_codon:yes stop_codon:yes gene_type:complete